MEKAGYTLTAHFIFTGELLDRTFLCSQFPAQEAF